jgi:hypothetical protein
LSIKALEDKGCTDDDILKLLTSFSDKFEDINEAYQGLAKPLSEIK